MSHLLATRYAVKEDFGISKTIEKLDNLDKKIKEDKQAIEAKEKAKKAEKEIASLKAQHGEMVNEYNNEVRNAKAKIGAEMYKRFKENIGKFKSKKSCCKICSVILIISLIFLVIIIIIATKKGKNKIAICRYMSG